MNETDAEDGQIGGERGNGQFNRMVGRRGVTRAVAEKDPVGVDGEDIVGGAGRRQHVHLDTALGQFPWRVRLDAQVDRGHRGTPRAASGHHVGRLAGDVRHQIGTLHLGVETHPGEQRVHIGADRADTHPHGPPVAQVPRQRAGVDMTDAHNGLRDQFVV